MAEVINSADLARRLGYSDADYDEFHRNVERVRDALRALGAPKAGETQQSRWLVSEDMANQVAQRLGRRLS